MSRLIDADKLKEMMDEILMPGKDVDMETYINAVVCAVVDDCPTIDAEPVRHGELRSTGYDEAYWEWGVCSICGSNNMMDSKFCNECGARLDGRKENAD